MRLGELAKELGITPKDLITFFKENGKPYTSHMQKVSDEDYDFAKANFKGNVGASKVIEVSQVAVAESKPTKTFNNDDLIPCKSVVPFKLNALSADKLRVYHWEYYGDVEYITYKDLCALRRTDYITKPYILIDDADLCYQWRRELGDTYKYFLGVDYPEDFFLLDDAKFETLLEEAPKVLKDVLKSTATAMIHAENYPSIQKLQTMDRVLDTCLMEFLK